VLASGSTVGAGVAHVGMPGTHSPTSNTTFYRFWEPVMQPLDEN